MESRGQEYAPGTNSYRHWLNISIATLLTEVGFDKSEPMALETLGEMSQSFPKTRVTFPGHLGYYGLMWTYICYSL